MPRERKDSKSLNIRLDRCLAERLEAYCFDLGQTKTTAIERILLKHLDEYEGKSSRRNSAQDS